MDRDDLRDRPGAITWRWHREVARAPLQGDVSRRRGIGRAAVWIWGLAAVGALFLHAAPAPAQSPPLQGGVQQNDELNTNTRGGVGENGTCDDDLWPREQDGWECLVPPPPYTVHHKRWCNWSPQRGTLLCYDSGYVPPYLQGGAEQTRRPSGPGRPPLQGGVRRPGYPQQPQWQGAPQSPASDPVPPVLRAAINRGDCWWTSAGQVQCRPVPRDCSKGAPGAYDPSQNPGCSTTPPPRLARSPQLPPERAPQQGPNPWPRTQDDRCTPVPAAATSTRLRKTGIEVLDTLAAMGQQADRSLDAMGQAIKTQLAYLTQPNAEVWRDRRMTGQAVVDYMANDVAANHATLRQAAEAELRQLQRDPASAVGYASAQILAGRAVQVVPGACSATASRLRAAATEQVKAQRAVARFKEMASAERGQLSGPSSLCGAGLGPSAPPSRYNPAGRRLSCVPASWAAQISDETGFNWDETHFNWSKKDELTPWNRIYAVQKNTWGDRVFGNLDPTRRMLQSEGMPAMIREGQAGIENELRAAGNGASGFVTIFRQDGTAHMFRARNFNGRIAYQDSATNTPGRFNFMNDFNGGRPLQAVWFYRTTGQDLVR